MAEARPIRVVDLAERLASFEERWTPKVVARLNGQDVRLAKLEGGFTWHAHEQEDELFLVVAGSLRIELRDRELRLAPGQLCVVPRGVEHRPVAEPYAEVLLFEPSATLNTGDAEDPRRADRLEDI